MFKFTDDLTDSTLLTGKKSFPGKSLNDDILATTALALSSWVYIYHQQIKTEHNLIIFLSL